MATVSTPAFGRLKGFADETSEATGKPARPVPAVEEFAQRVLNTCPYVKVAAIEAPTAKAGFVPQLVDPGSFPRCDIQERLVFTPRSRAENDAVAEIFVLRARAARF